MLLLILLIISCNIILYIIYIISKCFALFYLIDQTDLSPELLEKKHIWKR